LLIGRGRRQLAICEGGDGGDTAPAPRGYEDDEDDEDDEGGMAKCKSGEREAVNRV
jgi:hypothetical protein